MGERERELVALLLSIFLMYGDCKCSVALPLDAIGWCAVCDCGIYWS